MKLVEVFQEFLDSNFIDFNINVEFILLVIERHEVVLVELFLVRKSSNERFHGLSVRTADLSHENLIVDLASEKSNFVKILAFSFSHCVVEASILAKVNINNFLLVFKTAFS